VLLGLVIAAVVSTAGFASTITGDPFADGWYGGGHSLENGVYVRNNANYGFEVYSTAITITAGSNLVVGSGDYAWLAGDTVLGLGGRFADITATEADWDSFTGNAVNSILGESTKLIGKFGTDAATFSASTIAPGAGNGVGGTSDGGTGTVFMRSSGWFYAADWAAGSGNLMLLDKDSHISRVGSSTAPNKEVARLIWNWDADSGHVSSWELLLNSSLLDRLQPSFANWTPGIGDLAIVSVQNRDSAYTDALATIVGGAAPVPEPASMGILGLGLLGLVVTRMRRR
jgi:hypothetical protein